MSVIPVFVESATGSWLDWAGLAASLVTLIFVAWSAYSQWQSGRNQVQPVFAIWASYPGHEDGLCTIDVHNKGFGPAIIRDFQVFYKEKKGKGFSHEKVRDVLGKAFEGQIRVSKVAAMDFGFAMGANDYMTIASFYPPEEKGPPDGGRECLRMPNDELAGYMADFSLVIRYTDVYERKWVFVTDKFKGHTFRDCQRGKIYQKFAHLLT
ncbi:hypothetical protein [Salinicola sp. RZ23]|uniref:hypothetical protein n=1 Tax=Salinicola sp. RZ23 TaxID=1949087 RepID=UPI0013005354|nr:hypothetical protein [Salinicola sp. RZ23]